MATREVLSSANRGVGGFDSTAQRPTPGATYVRYVIRMTEAQRANTANRFRMMIYGSVDNWATRQYLGETDWQGGTEINKQGQEVTKGPPAVTLEATPSVLEMDILARIDCENSVRFSLDLED